MKAKFKILIALFALLITTVSCEPWGWWGSGNDDSSRGYYLSGSWIGDLGVYIDGRPAYVSELSFYPETGTYWYGYGYERDYYDRWGRYIENYFDWEIQNGVIFLYFDDPNLNCRISDYSLSANYFSGYMDGYGLSTRFRLQAYDRYWGDYFDVYRSVAPLPTDSIRGAGKLERHLERIQTGESEPHVEK